MLFAYDIVLIKETRGGVNDRLQIWRQNLESKRFRLCMIKTEYLECKFSDVTHEASMEVILDTQFVPKRERFKYLWSLIPRNGENDNDITHRNGAAWMKWRLASVLASQELPGPEDASSRNEDVEMNVIRNEDIQDKARETFVVNKMRQCVMKRCEKLDIMRSKRGRGKPKMYSGEVIKLDSEYFQLTEDMTLDRRVSRIRVEGFALHPMLVATFSTLFSSSLHLNLQHLSQGSFENNLHLHEVVGRCGKWKRILIFRSSDGYEYAKAPYMMDNNVNNQIMIRCRYKKDEIQPIRGGPVVWAWDFHVGGFKFEPLASESKGFAFWVELVAPGLPSASYLSYVVCKLLHRSGGFILCASKG
ncbi:hypothetical protein H5410_005855 [Solanum commersonii]|uniref:Uncharacterized protein n=1 Tax=Solanum commersonii TaxID=4109 RepID=A0A9J6A7R8_SOLCO|nr:hypothetical protein H5410_005855 [Solanum commersonii]